MVTEIKDEDTYDSLHDRLKEIGAKLILENLELYLEGKLIGIPQDENEVTISPNISKEEEHLDFNKTSREVFNLIRGLSPIPGANAILDSEEMKIYASRIGDKINNGNTCGEVCSIYKDGIGIWCSDREIIITDIKPFGKKRMLVNSYLNGIDKNKLIGKVFE